MPQYPQATAALAIAVLNAAYLGWAENAEANYAEAYELAQRAVALDRPLSECPLLPSVWSACGRAAPIARSRSFEEAIKLNPSFAAAHVHLGQMYLYAGRPEEAIAQAEKGSASAPAIRACSSGCPRWPGRTTSYAAL